MNKLSKLLNVVIYLCIISYALPTGVMKGIPIQKILVCLLIILGGICLVLQRKSLEIIKSAKLEITLGVLGLLACIVSYILGNEWSIKFTGKDCRMYHLYDAFEDSGKNNHRNRLCM